MFKLSNKTIKKLSNLLLGYQPVCVGNGYSLDTCTCMGQCGNTGSSEHYRCPSAANDQGSEN